MIIYKVTNKINGKIYIGQTTQELHCRWRDHCRGDKQRDSYLHRAIKKYGIDNFIIEQIDMAGTLDGLNLLEEMHIKKHGCLSPVGYNLLPGGNNRRAHQETRDKISQKLKGRKIPNRWDKGRTGPHSDETKAKLSEALKGKAFSGDRWTGGNRMPRTDAQKAHLSAKIKGRPNTVLYKKIQCVETGIIYESVNATAAAHGCNRVTISGLLKSGKKGGKLGTKGFSFKYL